MSASFVRNSGFGTIAGVIITFGNFLGSLIIARTLGVQATGEIAFAIWMVGILTTFSALGLPFTMSRYLPDISARQSRQDARALATFLLRIYGAISSLPLLGWVIYAGWLAFKHSSGPPPTPYQTPVVAFLIGAICLAQALSEFTKAYLRGMCEFDRLASASAISVAIQVLALFIGAHFFGLRGALCGYLVGSLAMLPPLVGVVLLKPIMPDATGGRVLRYTLFRWGAEILAIFIWSRIELFFLQIYSGPKSVALFSVGLTLANVAIQGPLMLTLGLLPHFTEKFAAADTASTQRAYTLATCVMACLVLPACFGLAAISPILLPLFFGRDFSGAVPAAVILVVVSSISATASVGDAVISSTERSDIDFYTGMVGSILACIGGIYLIKTYGLVGAAISRGAVQTIVVTLSSLFLIKGLKRSIPFGPLLRIGAAAISCAVVARIVMIILPNVGGLFVAIASAIIVYLGIIRVSSIFTSHDIDKMRSLARGLPRPLPQFANFLLPYPSAENSAGASD